MCLLSISILNYPARQDTPRHTNAVECLKYRTLILPCSVVVMSWHNFPAAIGHKAIFPAIRTCMPWHTLPPIARNFTLCNHMQPQTRSRFTHGSVKTFEAHYTPNIRTVVNQTFTFCTYSHRCTIPFFRMLNTYFTCRWHGKYFQLPCIVGSLWTAQAITCLWASHCFALLTRSIRSKRSGIHPDNYFTCLRTLKGKTGRPL